MAARLADSDGVEVEVYNTNPEIARAVQERGLVLLDKGRRTARPVRLLEGPGQRDPATPRLDVLILATKGVGLQKTAREMLPVLAKEGLVVTTQNGLAAMDLAEALGSHRVVAGAVLWGASMDAPGVCRITAHGPFLIGRVQTGEDPSGSGEPGGRNGGDGRAGADGRNGGDGREGGRAPEGAAPGTDSGLERTAAVLGRIFPVRVSGNMPGVLWSKLAITASLTTLGAITGLRFGELVRSRQLRRVLLGLGGEVLTAARAAGVTLEPLAGGLDVERLLAPGGYPNALRHLLMRIVGWKHRSTESSMLDSLRRGRKTEIELINGRVVGQCDAAGLPCPLNRAAIELVRELEAGTVHPDVELLKRFAVG
jgi:2-dehydropantoate 2-reductase